MSRVQSTGAVIRPLALAIGALGLAPLAEAGGLMVWEIGTPTLGTAGAGWAAMPEDASTAFTNPAGTVWRDNTEIRAAGQLLYGDVDFSRGEESNVPGNDGGNPVGWFPGGGAFVAGRLTDNLGWGLAMAGNFGGVLDYKDEWAGRRFLQDVDLLGMSLIPSMSWKIHPCLSVGVGLNVMAGYFNWKSAPRAGLLGGDGSLEYSDVDFGYGGNLGLTYRPVPSTTLGFTYTSRVDLDFDARMELDSFGPLFDIAVERFDGRRTRIGMNVPATYTASLQQELTSTTNFYMNIGWQEWSTYSPLALELDDPEQTSLRIDRGYRDTGHFALGARHGFVDGLMRDWSVSAGIAYDSAMVKTSTLTADIPTAEASWRFGVGAGKELCPGLTLDLGYTLVWQGDIDIDQQGRPPFSPRLQGTFEDVSLHFFGGSLQFEL
ncbi:OmpP1/FadL family transporter [Microbulbifer guangxiensis]|uniref:OmpP1/FadL family transporter n=1 Tax=Microbulbifer guangxiensis TaxID=2904249 RepID=UPI00210675E4|nr:outer membrane protein transport protein [Microbulbifer guangxiensis]